MLSVNHSSDEKVKTNTPSTDAFHEQNQPKSSQRIEQHNPLRNSQVNTMALVQPYPHENEKPNALSVTHSWIRKSSPTHHSAEERGVYGAEIRHIECGLGRAVEDRLRCLVRSQN